MKTIPTRLFSYLTVIVLTAYLATSANAEQSSNFSDYVVHYNALPTNLIEPAIARPYGILRSKNRALLNIAVLRKVMGTAGQPVRAEVIATATNLNQQLREITMRQVTSSVEEGSSAIYYIGEFPVSNEENVNFEVSITPEGTSITHTITFEQQFFTQ